jgi:hypothetical protein
MEPKAAMTTQVVLALAAIALLSLQGATDTATAVAVGLAGFAAALDLSYVVRARGRRCLVLAHRRWLDRLVRTQWLCLLGAGAAIAQSLGAAEAHPLSAASDAVKILIAASAIGIGTIYASSLVDWYWVLPKISGIVAPPPCTRVVAKTYAGVTKVWLFHRAAATAVITALIAGTPAYIAGTVAEGSLTRAALTVLGAAAAIGFNAATAGTVWAFRQFLSPQLEVGSYVRKRKNVDAIDPQDAYIVDVSVQGVKVKLEDEVDGKFVSDGDLVPYHEAAQLTKSKRTDSMCPSLNACRAVNWYCLRNRNANNASYAPHERAPAELPLEAIRMLQARGEFEAVEARHEPSLLKFIRSAPDFDQLGVDRAEDAGRDVTL